MLLTVQAFGGEDLITPSCIPRKKECYMPV